MQTHYWGCLVQPQHHDVWTKYEIDKPLANAEGGEGGIYTLIPHSGEKRVAKIYNPASKALLKPDAFNSLAFLASKYAELSEPGALPFVAWPIEVLFTVKHPSSIQHLATLAGITMRHISGHGVLEKLTTNGNGRFGLGTEKAVRIAATIASYLNRMHERSIVFCDFNPKNILVSNDHEKITFVDADAFQHPFGTAFTKAHYFPGYASPAHIEGKPGQRTPADDNFVLAIHIFQLLLDGGHPFDTGPAFNPSGDPFATITPHDNIKAKRWPYSNVALFQPPGETPRHYARLHPDLRAMFTRAFQQFNPPTAAEWESALPKFRSNVDGAAPPKAKPLAAAPIAPKPPPQPAVPARPRLPVNFQPQPVPAPPATVITQPAPPMTAKRVLRIVLALIGGHLGRLLVCALKWCGRTLTDLAMAGGRSFRRHGGAEITAGLIFIAGLFWFLDAYEKHPDAIARSPQEPSLTAFTTTVTSAAPPPQAVSETSTTATIMPAPGETETLPWLQPKAEPSPMVPRPRLSVEELNRRADEISRQRQRRHARRTTHRDRSTEYRLAPDARPFLRIRPTN